MMDRFTIDSKTSSELLPFQKGSGVTDKGFGEKLKQAVQEVNRLQQVADRSVEQVIKGNLGIHEGMIAIQEADISLRLLLQVKNKVMEAYRQLMAM